MRDGDQHHLVRIGETESVPDRPEARRQPELAERVNRRSSHERFPVADSAFVLRTHRPENVS